jgi:hypothetical protein
MDPIRTGFAREHIASWPSGKLNPHPLTRSNASWPLVQLFECNLPNSFESFNPHVQTSGPITLSKKFLALYTTKYVTTMVRTWHNLGYNQRLLAFPHPKRWKLTDLCLLFLTLVKLDRVGCIVCLWYGLHPTKFLDCIRKVSSWTQTSL